MDYSPARHEAKPEFMMNRRTKKYDLVDDGPPGFVPTREQLIDRAAERIWMLCKLNQTQLDSQRMIDAIKEITESLIQIYVDELAEEYAKHAETVMKLRALRAEMRKAK